MSQSSEHCNTILVVDDAPTNLSVLVDNLTSPVCRVLTAESAKSALNRLEHVIPDLILLDVMMPEMDGYTLCRELKKHSIYKDIPVIFLTAKTESDDLIEGFRAGSVDYVTKPFRKEELSMRINTHLELQNARQKLKEYAHTLEDRNKRLSELVNEKNEFIGVATHDLRNPLSVLNLALDLFRIKTKGKDIAEVEPLINQMDETIKRMTTLVSKLLEINRLDVGQYELHMEPTKIEPLCAELIVQNRLKANFKQIELHYNSEQAGDPEVMIDPTAFTQIVENLLSNAIKYVPLGTSVYCSLELVDSGGELPDLILIDKKVRFVVRDEGPGIAEEEHDRVFRRYAKTSNQPTGDESSSGLGLSIAKRLAKEMMGDIGFVSNKDQGSTFYLEIPYRG